MKGFPLAALPPGNGWAAAPRLPRPLPAAASPPPPLPPPGGGGGGSSAPLRSAPRAVPGALCLVAVMTAAAVTDAARYQPYKRSPVSSLRGVAARRPTMPKSVGL